MADGDSYVTCAGSGAGIKVRRRVQQAIHGHCGRKVGRLYAIRTVLRCGAEKLTGRQHTRLDRPITIGERHNDVLIACVRAR